MKLRFGIEAAMRERVGAKLDAMSDAPPACCRLDDVYLDTPDDDLARRGIALRFRRLSRPQARDDRRSWTRRELWPKGEPRGSIKRLGIPRLKQRLDATFTVRVERSTWRPRGGWAAVSLDRGEVSTGAERQAFDELRIVCRRKRADEAMTLAVELGALHLSSVRPRDRGLALLRD